MTRHNPFRNQVYFAEWWAKFNAALRAVTIPLEIRSILLLLHKPLSVKALRGGIREPPSFINDLDKIVKSNFSNHL